MDIIDRVIAKVGYEKLPLKRFHNTWQDFERAIGNRKFHLYGIGVGANFYFLKYGSFTRVARAFDNAKNLQGLPLCAITIDFESDEKIIVEDPGLLKEDNTHKNVYLISSLNHFVEIADDLERKNIKNYYSILCMEAKDRMLYGTNILLQSREEWIQKYYRLLFTKKICVYSNCDGAGHAKAIINALHSIRNDLDVVWIVDSWFVKFDRGIRKRLSTNGYACDFEYATALVWIRDSGGGGFPTIISKKAGQVGIELKHWSSITLKKFAFDEKTFMNNKEIENSFKKNISYIDYVLVGSDFDERTCRSGLRIKGEYIHVGSPRSDVLFTKYRKKKFMTSYPFLGNKYILLYAPTFRRLGENLTEVGYRNELNFELIHQTMINKFGGEWVILLRLHPMVANCSKDMILPDFVIDVSNYQDSEELVAACDALITDYSSIMFEPAYINIPVFLLATDLDEYTSNERDFYIDYETLPFPIAKNNEELRENILAFDQNKYEANVAAFFDKYGVHEDGHAAERAAKFISDLIDRKVEQENE